MTIIEETATTEPAPTLAQASGWVRVCSLGDLEVERGRAALLGDVQIALFLLADGSVRAVSNYDPYGRANVLSRGIVGTKSLGNAKSAGNMDATSGNTGLSDSEHRKPREDVPTIASPLHKQAWDLRTGMVVETQGKDALDIPVWPVAVRDGEVLIRFPK